MQQVITAKLKLHTDPAQFQALRRAQLAYRDALNAVSRYAFAHGKLSNPQALQHACYEQIRTENGLPAQMACNVPRQVGATYKTLWTKMKANTAARQAGVTKKRYKGLDQPPTYVSPTLIYNYHRDFSLKAEQRVSILTLDGRVTVPYTGYDPHVALMQQGTHNGVHIGAAKLWYDKPRKQFYLLVSLDVEVAAPTPATHQRIVGVDVGQRYLAVATDMHDHTLFFPGNAVRAKADHYARLRKRLQHKGTRAATRRLIVIAGRERRLKQDRDHLISRRIVDAYPHALIGLEELIGIRDRTKRRHGKRASHKQRKANRHAAQWAFAELHSYVAYKALLVGSRSIRVDPYQTSQACPQRGHAVAANRPDHGLLFSCQREECQFSLHADLVGARNVALRTLLARQDWVSTGVLSERPDVSDEEAKAAQRRRYAELRWSLDTSPALEGWGI